MAWQMVLVWRFVQTTGLSLLADALGIERIELKWCSCAISLRSHHGVSVVLADALGDERVGRSSFLMSCG